MKVISKATAEMIANELVGDSIKNKIKDLETQTREKAEQYALSQIPQEIAGLYKRFEDFFKFQSRVNIHANGMRIRVDLSFSIPVKTWDIPNINVSQEEFEWFKNNYRLIQELEKEEQLLVQQLTDTIFSIRTPKRLEEQFPKAFELLPKENSKMTSIALPIDDLLKRLNSYK